MIIESHTEPAHHAYGVRSRVVQVPGCVPGDVGSIPIARPNNSDEFTEPDCDFAVGQHYDCASVAQAVEHSVEARGVTGSTPVRSTSTKLKA